jgi:transcriptional accessory protein Tex/SPT6
MEEGSMPNLLDSTNVHPEAYDSAKELIRLAGVQLEDLGKPEFQAKINAFVQKRGISKLRVWCRSTFNEIFVKEPAPCINHFSLRTSKL